MYVGTGIQTSWQYHFPSNSQQNTAHTIRVWYILLPQNQSASTQKCLISLTPVCLSYWEPTRSNMQLNQFSSLGMQSSLNTIDKKDVCCHNHHCLVQFLWDFLPDQLTLQPTNSIQNVTFQKHQNASLRLILSQLQKTTVQCVQLKHFTRYKVIFLWHPSL